MALKYIDTKRATYNRKLIILIQDYLNTHPGVRFQQALINLGLADENYNEEPWDTYEKALVNFK